MWCCRYTSHHPRRWQSLSTCHWQEHGHLPSLTPLMGGCVQGTAVREPIVLPDCPLALAHSGLFVVTVMDGSVQVFDIGGQLVRCFPLDLGSGRLLCADEDYQS